MWELTNPEETQVCTTSEKLNIMKKLLIYDKISFANNLLLVK